MARGVAGALCFATAGAFGVAAAEPYPVRPVRIIVPQSAGGTTDLTARVIGPRLAERFGQTVVIDNRPGAGSLLGIDLAAKSALNRND
jgi:tripartite-type tricarboxylate transporter receptor subunit TctC